MNLPPVNSWTAAASLASRFGWRRYMLVIAVPSLIRLVWSPSASEHASESLFASVMKTPEKPASSAARAHSISRAGGLSGSIVHASAILAMINFLLVQSVASALSPQRRDVDAEHLGGLLERHRLLEHYFDMSALHLFERQAVVELVRRREDL